MRSTPWFRFTCASLQVDQFGDAQPRGVEHLEHRPVAMPQRIADGRSGQQGLDFLLQSDFGSERPTLGIAICAVGSSRNTPSRTR